MQFLNRVRLWQKLALLVVAMAVPTALLGVFYLSGANAQVALASNEIEGARYVQSVGAVLAEAANHRSRLFALLTGDAERRDEVSSSETEMDKLVADVDANDTQVGARFGVSETWHAIKSDWEHLRVEGPKLTAAEGVARHNALIDRVLKLGGTISARSGLNVDPSAQTAVLIRIATHDVPEALIASGNIRWYATRASIKSYLGGDDRLALQLYHDDFADHFGAAAGELDRASEDAQAHLRPAVESARNAFNAGYGTIKEKILDAQKLEITTADLYAATREISSTLQHLSDVSYSAMDAAVQQRLSQVTTWRNLTAGITAAALAVGLVLSWLITRSLSEPLARAVAVFGNISVGKYDNPIELGGTDEASQVLRALSEMQGKLRTQIETERSVAAENTRIRQALDKVSTSVVLADGQYQIIYVNETAQAMFARNQEEIRRTLPSFDASRLRGASMDVLSIEPNHMRRVLDTLVGSDTQERVLGACTLRSIASPVRDDKGERIGTVVEWTDRTQEVAVEKELQNMLSAVVAGDLSKRIELAGKAGFFEAMSRGVNELADNMTKVISQVKLVAAEVRRGADEISAGNANLSQHTVEQASSLEETASSMEEMTGTVRQNADNAAQANQLALAAHGQAEKGGIVVSHAIKAMADINDASGKIADIIGVIDEIAFQTNLLALNAAVEAARAGEQGRGFAVVASEVRNLAGRSATAAKEIKELIQNSVKKVEDGSLLVTQSGHTLHEIVISVKKVSDIVGEIAAASREQSSGIEQVNHAVVQMDQITQQNAALVEQAAAASQTMAEQVHGLNELLAHYQVGQAMVGRSIVSAAPDGNAAEIARLHPGFNTPPGARSLKGSAIHRLGAPTLVRRAALTAREPLVRAGNGTDADWHEF